MYGMAHSASYKKAKPLSESGVASPETFTNISAYNKLKAYSEVAKEKLGEDYDLRGKPIDPELVMISGGGRCRARFCPQVFWILLVKTVEELTMFLSINNCLGSWRTRWLVDLQG